MIKANYYHTRWLVTGLWFKSDGNFVNLACIDPSELVAVKSGTKGHRICHSGGASSSLSTSVVCISLVQVMSCHIIDPFTTGGGQIIKGYTIHWKTSVFRPAVAWSLVPEVCKLLSEMVC